MGTPGHNPGHSSGHNSGHRDEGQQHGPIPTDVLGISSYSDGRTAVIELEGELDLHGSSRLAAEVEQLLVDSAERLQIDAERLTFADSAGLRAILVARDEAQARGLGFELTRVSDPVARVIRMAGLAEILLPPDT
jgi:anti-anti-sigma factor